MEVHVRCELVRYVGIKMFQIEKPTCRMWEIKMRCVIEKNFKVGSFGTMVDILAQSVMALLQK
jgi:hypothetical protein